MAKRKRFWRILGSIGFALVVSGSEVRAAKVMVVPKWERFELTLKSHHGYTNALQQAELRVLFVSPLGETNRAYGFWDGGKTWRVRFAPNFPGRWKFYTMCSDTANAGLHEQAGEFLCSAAAGSYRFGEHGPIQVARDQEHFEHADRTPFLWLGDAAWDAAARSSISDWEHYAKTRATQKFNVVQWRLASAEAGQTPVAFTGRECITLNLAFFKQLDAKVAALTGAGLLNAIAPLWEIGADADRTLPEDQAIALLRYVVARWGGNPVAWILAFESDRTGAQAARWQRIGRAVFNPIAHGPVILLPGEAPWVLSEFRSESWVDALGFQTTQVTDDDALPWLLQGPLALERSKLPARPLLTLAPAGEAAPQAEGGNPSTAGFARRVLWWSLLINTPAGVSYSAKDIADWLTTKAHSTEQPWREALGLPGASAMVPLAGFFDPIEFWRLTPFPRAAIVQAGESSFRDHVTVSVSQVGNVVLLYVPEAQTLRIPPGIWSATAKATWFDPRTGASRPASSAVAKPTGWEITTPGAGDWVLVVYPNK
ncbi:MAG: DUF4038 domain-containing protein [Verrucomicrobia bacterium]|nr:DUF4038 domain-containing protein [Verrucomicrobiota bacterium]